MQFQLPYYWQFYIWDTKGTIRFSLNEDTTYYYLARHKDPFPLLEEKVEGSYLTDFLDLVADKKAELPMEEVFRSTRTTLGIN